MYRLHSNGAYWQVVFNDGDTQVRRILGSKAALTKRAAQALIEDMVQKHLAEGVQHRAKATLGDWCNRYIRLRTAELSRPTRLIHQRVTESLIEHFGFDRDLASITRADMADWRAGVGATRAESTACKYSRTAKVIFSRAVDEEILDRSPASKLRSTAPVQDPFSRRLITADEVEAVIERPGPHRVAIAIAWHAGLRTSEITHLRWTDIQADRLIVRPRDGVQSSKQRGREVRLEPELRSLLLAIDEPRDGTVCRLIETGQVNLLSRFARSACESADVRPFTLQDLRRARDTRWHMEYPAHVCCAWMGHSESVARQHYLAIPDVYYSRDRPNAVVGQVSS